MKIYHCLKPFDSNYGKLGLDKSPNHSSALLLFTGGNESEYQRYHLEPFILIYYPAMDREQELMKSERLLIRLYQVGTFGYERQLEYDTEKWHSKCDRLSGYIHEIDADRSDAIQYNWLIDAGSFIVKKDDQRQRENFFSGAIVKSNSKFENQIPIQF